MYFQKRVCEVQDIIEFVATSKEKEFIIGTEKGIMHALTKRYPDKKFYLLSENLVCRTMKYTTLEDILDILTLKDKASELNSAWT